MEIFGLLMGVAGLAVLVAPWAALGKASAAERRAEQAHREIEKLRKEIAQLSSQIEALSRGALRDGSAAASSVKLDTPASEAAASVRLDTPVMEAGPSPTPDTPAPAAPPVVVTAVTPFPTATPPVPPPIVAAPLPLLPPMPTEAAPPQRLPVRPPAAPVSPAAQASAEVPVDLWATPAPVPGTPKFAPPPARPPLPPRPPINWEQRIVAATPWMAAVIISLAGVFAVKVMTDHGFFGPRVRISLATVSGLGLIAFAQWVRASQARIAEATAAAGITTLYAALLASFKLYQMMGQLPAFAGVVVITTAAVLLSLRHGSLVALLGLIGGFTMPALLATGQPPPPELFLYLFLLEAGLTVLTRERRWEWLTLLTMFFGLGWAAVWIGFFFQPEHGHFVGLFLLASIASFVFASVEREPVETERPLLLEAIPWAAVVLGMGLVAWLVGASGFSTVEWAMLGVLGSGCMVLGRLRSRYLPLAAVAAAAGLMMLWVWGSQGGAQADSFKWVILGYGVLYAGGSYAALWGAPVPMVWAWLSVATGLAYLAVAGHFLPGRLPLPHWAITAIIAACYAAGAAVVQPRRRELDDGDEVMTAMSFAVTALTSWASLLFVQHQGYGHQWISVAWALEVTALAWAAWWLVLPVLRPLAALIAAGVVLRLLFNPDVLYYAYGPNLIFTWVLYGYGVPIAAFLAAAVRLRRDGEAQFADWLEAAAAGFAFALVGLTVRHAFHPTDMLEGTHGLYELATYSVSWLAMGVMMLFAAKRWTEPALYWAARVVGLAGLLAALAGPGVIANPLWASAAIGTGIVWNGLLYAFVVPAVLAAWMAALLSRNSETEASYLFGTGALLLALLTSGLFVHHGFHPEDMTVMAASVLEYSTYSVVWGSLALLLLAAAHRFERSLVGTLGIGAAVLSVLAVTLGSGVAANPLWTPYRIGESPLLNWLLYAYALPTLLVAAIATTLDRTTKKEAAAGFTAIAIVMLVCTLGMFVHHGFRPDMTNHDVSLLEFGTYAVVLGALGWTMSAMATLVGREVFTLGAADVTAFSWVLAIVGPVVLANPLWTHEAVGAAPVVNWLLYVYGVPAGLAAATAWSKREGTEPSLAFAGGIVSLILSFVLVTLQVRQAFHGEFLDVGAPTNAEWYSYSAAWIVFAAALLVPGVWLQSKVLRWASLAVMLSAVVKVFVFDTRNLIDLWRVLSYLGMGLSLLMLSWVYQRFVFGDRVTAGSDGEV